MNLNIGDKVLVKANTTRRSFNAIVKELDSPSSTCTEVWISKGNSSEEEMISFDEIEPIVSRNGFLLKL